MSTPDPTTPGPAGPPVPPATATATPSGDGVATPPARPAAGAPAPASHGTGRRWWLWGLGAAVLLLALVAGVPWAVRALTTASTDDAYVNGHVTFVAPRVAGQVAKVLVDDNNR